MHAGACTCVLCAVCIRVLALGNVNHVHAHPGLPEMPSLMCPVFFFKESNARRRQTNVAFAHTVAGTGGTTYSIAIVVNAFSAQVLWCAGKHKDGSPAHQKTYTEQEQNMSQMR